MATLLHLARSFLSVANNRQDLGLVEVMQRLLSLALDKVRAAGIIVEDAVLAIVDAVIRVAGDMLRTGKRQEHMNDIITVG